MAPIKSTLARLVMSPVALIVAIAPPAAAEPILERPSSLVARGQFDVTIKLGATPDVGPGGALGRQSFDKQYSGDLVASGAGEMLTATTPTKGSAAYVAIERVTGVLQGRRGSFILRHAGVMARGADQRLNVEIVPDSGTEELLGVVGAMTITVNGGEHRFELNYMLPR